MITLLEILKIQIWSFEKDNYYQEPFKNKLSVQALVDLFTQHGYKLDLTQQMNLWLQVKELLINGYCKMVLQWVHQILYYQKIYKKKFKQTKKISLRNILNHLIGIETKRLLNKKPSIKEVRKLLIHLIFM